MNINVRPAADADRDRIAKTLVDSYGATVVVGHDTVYDVMTLPTLVAEHAGELVGILSFQVDGDALEVVSIDAIDRHRGVGSALLAAAINEARERGCQKVWLVTSNDNLDALRFYQRRGMSIVAVAPGAVDRARALKPEIPEVGDYNIPMHDELTLELRLD